ncbi:MAG: hypothetical protein KUG71_00640 [Porticoccaceae bacterium]|nr:hypothetical protein [Porticoccaceae bacterium]
MTTVTTGSSDERNDKGSTLAANPASTPERFKLPLMSILFGIAFLVAMYTGWQLRNEFILSAEYGIGYALGIVGGSMMLILLIYPLKKRFYDNSMFIFSTRTWFKWHMIMGLVGPLLVLYHCNFSLGSTNSNIALACMLLMVASGLVGRFIYGKIHFGLYGKKVELAELKNHKLWAQKQLDADRGDDLLYISENLANKLKAFEQKVLKRGGLIGNFFNILSLGISTRMAYTALLGHLKKDQRLNSKYQQLSEAERQLHYSAVREHIAAYLSTVRKTAGLSFYEHLFSLWHMLHLPIFFMLIITGFVHVYAVHTY